MIHVDLGKIVSLQKGEMFDRILGQLISQAGIYSQRETTGNEPGDEVHIGEKMNIYAAYFSYQLWILPKPETI